MSDIVIRLWNKRKLCQVIFYVVHPSVDTFFRLITFVDVIKSKSDKHTVDNSNRGGERIIFCRYFTDDGAAGILDVFVYDTHAIAE